MKRFSELNNRKKIMILFLGFIIIFILLTSLPYQSSDSSLLAFAKNKCNFYGMELVNNYSDIVKRELIICSDNRTFKLVPISFGYKPKYNISLTFT